MMINFENFRDNLDFAGKESELKDAVTKSSLIFDTKHNRQLNRDLTWSPVNIPLAAAVIGVNNTDISIDEEAAASPIWTDIDAQQAYLRSKPTSYLLVGKPSVGTYSIGEALAKKLNCYHLCPRNLILDEITQGSPTGKCLHFNLKHRAKIQYDVLVKILKCKLYSEAIKHKGYVLSGFPLVDSSASELYFIEQLYAEESLHEVVGLLLELISNLRKTKKKGKKKEFGEEAIDAEENEEEEVQEELEEEEDKPVVIPKYLLDTCDGLISSHAISYKTKEEAYLEQISEIFNLDIKPDVIIYVTCSDADVIGKKGMKLFNYTSNSLKYNQPYKETVKDVRWPMRYSVRAFDNPRERSSHNIKYNCKHPLNFKRNAIDQLCNYNKKMYPFFEKVMLEYDPKKIIKVDGLMPIYEIIYNIMERLIVLCIQPVLTPEPLQLSELPDEISELWEMIENFNVIKDGVLKFNRYASFWQNRCPIELEKGRTEIGRGKYAVVFFKHVYLMSSEEGMIKFIKNPRPFLHLNILEPKCRVIVVGTPLSGKTMVSNCLSWIFDAPIFDYKKFHAEQYLEKLNKFSATIFSEIQPIIEERRLSVWQNDELQRLSKLDEWVEKNHATLKKYIPFLEKLLQNQDIEPSFKKKMDAIKKDIQFLPFLEDLNLCKIAISNKDELTKYAPSEFTVAFEKPKTPALGDEDVTNEIETYIEDNQLRETIIPSPEEIIRELRNTLSTFDTLEQEQVTKYGKWIIEYFPTETEYWTFLEEFKLLPDYTVGLIENRDLDPEILEQYNKIEHALKNHEERFLLADDPLIKIKLATKHPSSSNIFDVQIIMTELFNGVFETLLQEEKYLNEDSSENEKTLRESIEAVTEQWEGIKSKLEDSSRAYIEVLLENKSDVQVAEEVLLQIRKAYFFNPDVIEDEVDDNDLKKVESELLDNSNNPRFLGDMDTYCPITYYDYHVLWEGKSEFGVHYNHKNYYFANEENMILFQNDPTKFQQNAKPFRKMPCFRICLIGCVGSGKTSLSKFIAKELGLVHIDFSEFINDNLLPRHFQRVGRLYENSFTDTSLEDGSVTEFQVDEESESEANIMSNEKELRRLVFNYFERGTPLIPALIQKLIKKIWFDEPYSSVGFVLDGFPRLPTDLEEMIALSCVPDLILELTNSLDTTIQRLSEPMFKKWKSQLIEAKALARRKLDSEKKVWFDLITKEIVVELIIGELINNVVVEDIEDTTGLVGTPAQSVIIDADPLGSLNVDTNLFQLYHAKLETYPEPVDTNEWPDPEEVRESIEARLEALYDTDNENLEGLEETLTEQKIKLISLDADIPMDYVNRLALTKLKKLRKRNRSFLEQTYSISVDVAETLLSQGFYFLSKFCRMCPVYIFDNPKSIHNPYRSFKSNNDIHPVVHRCYIYFLNGANNVRAFRLDPLKYVTSNVIKYYVEYPLSIAVIGPPKSGKSTLSAKLASRYGLMCLSKGSAMRHLIENSSWSELASKINKQLCRGGTVPAELVNNVIQTFVTNHRFVTHGFVFDGFPANAAECLLLLNEGLYPSIVFDLQCRKPKVLMNLEKEIHRKILKYLPPYPQPYISYRYDKWKLHSQSIGAAIDRDYKNRFDIQCSDSRWQCLHTCNKIISALAPKIHYYLNNYSDEAVSVAPVCNSKLFIKSKLSNYKKFCPVCFHDNKLKCIGFSNNWDGMIQFEDRFYWICPKHLQQVLKCPKKFLSCQDVKIPEVPVIISIVDPTLVYENGVCIVTYANSLPSIKVVSGDNKFAASYNKKHYLFCSGECLDNFFEEPHLFHDIVVFKEVASFPAISLKKLPHLGYLEQTLGNMLTEACCLVNAVRPKYPGLDIATSGLIFIGLWLKTHGSSNSDYKAKYVKAYRVYRARCKLITDIGLRLRSSDNPFSHYPGCCTRSIESSEIGSNAKQSFVSSWSTYSGTGSEFREKIKDLKTDLVPVPDERFDYLCEYHKPASKVPAFLNVVDIAGLVRGAAEGQGLGNAFLSHIKACDAIFNLCRAFEDDDVIHVDGDVNPVRDLETIGEELRLKDEDQLMKDIEKLDRVVNRGNDKKLKPEYDTLMKIKSVLVDEKKHIRFGDWSVNDIEILNKYLFLTSKPALYLVNLSEKDYTRKKNKWLPKLKEWIDKNDPGAPLIPFSGCLESKLLDMEPAERDQYLKENNITSALDKIIVQGYRALQLEYFFTAGADEVKAWTIQKGTKAPQAAGRIHTDFEKGFIMAEVMHFKDFKDEGTEAACKAAGKYRQQGRNYVVEDGDIIFFKFNAGAGLKDAKKK